MTTHLTGIHATAVPVTDQDLALDFYTRALGMAVRMDADLAEGLRWVEVAPPGSAQGLALVRQEEGFGAGRDTGIRLVSADAAADHADLARRGVHVDELLRWPGVPPMFSLRDLDGNTLYVMELPG